MSRKAKFTPEEKEQAVIDYLEGNKSRIQICGELCISSRTIQDWALIYNKHGLAGFSKKMRNGSYSKEFKMKVVLTGLIFVTAIFPQAPPLISSISSLQAFPVAFTRRAI